MQYFQQSPILQLPNGYEVGGYCPRYPSNMGTPNVSSGLVEISTTATLIGAPIAEALVHGLKGSGGLAWAPMSSFGSVHVIKACLAAAVPDWARESIGLRNQHVDDALGLASLLNPAEATKNRVDLGDAKAIIIDHTPPRFTRLYFKALCKGGKWKKKEAEQGGNGMVSVSPTQENRIFRFYALDKKMTLLLDTITQPESGSRVPVYKYLPDTDGSPPTMRDWALLLLSLVKLCEVLWLWKWGSQVLWITTMIPWAWGFLAAVVLQGLGLSRDNPMEKTVDIVTGTLPTPLSIGEKGIILLGTPSNVRRVHLRRVLMAVGIPCNIVPLFMTFLNIQKENSAVSYLWIAFQALWLICRGVVYYFTESAAAVRQAVLSNPTWAEMDSSTRRRVFSVLDAVVRHQATVHPRGPKVYLTECEGFGSIPHFLSQAEWRLTTDLDPNDFKDYIEVTNAVGDIFFRTTAWFLSANLNSGELYDSCLLFINTGTTTQAVPCVRGRVCDCPLFGKGVRQRGNTHLCPTKQWRTFIRCRKQEQDMWIYIHAHGMVGKQHFELLSDEELNTQFATGVFRISFRGTNELHTAWKASWDACEVLLGFLADQGVREIS
ncbi:hypothetical protein F4804DRAFT_47293 [Jackrogersella minutella]|nr:hypothetical protein F4804DRAFT_47293 [Jackrogersella minutella]